MKPGKSFKKFAFLVSNTMQENHILNSYNPLSLTFQVLSIAHLVSIKKTRLVSDNSIEKCHLFCAFFLSSGGSFTTNISLYKKDFANSLKPKWPLPGFASYNNETSNRPYILSFEFIEKKGFGGSKGNAWRILDISKNLYILRAVLDLLKTRESALLYSCIT